MPLKDNNYLLLVRDLVLKPVRAFQCLENPGFSHLTFFIVYGLPLYIAASTARALISLKAQAAGNDLIAATEFPEFLTWFFIHLSSYLISLIAGSYLIFRLAPVFGGAAQRATVISLIVLAYTPFLVSQPLVAAGGRFLGPVALFLSALLIGTGLSTTAGIPQKKLVGFTIVCLFILFGISYILMTSLAGLIIFE